MDNIKKPNTYEITIEKMIKTIEILYSSFLRVENSFKAVELLAKYCKDNDDIYFFSRDFFDYSKRALEHFSMIELCKLFDKDTNKSMCMQEFKNRCYKSKNIFQNQIMVDSIFKEYGLYTKNYKNFLENIYEQRNHIWAHRDKKYYLNPSDAESEFFIPQDEIDYIVRTSKVFLKNLYKELKGEDIDSKYILKMEESIDKLFYLARLGWDNPNFY